MALTGLDIYKLLPKTNCGECKSPTCLAFAMRVAQKQASLEDCPHVSDEAKEQLGAASAPPIQLVTIGTGDFKLEIGNETVLFRHEETFHHPCGIAVTVSDALSEDEIAARADKIADETICDNANDLLPHLEKVGHPALAMPPMF
jgi:acetyl-CoA decarbonylase/synthase complex subunit gamma